MFSKRLIRVVERAVMRAWRNLALGAVEASSLGRPWEAMVEVLCLAVWRVGSLFNSVDHSRSTGGCYMHQTL